MCLPSVDDLLQNLVRVGLVMDMVGVVILFYCTTTRKIEAELANKIALDLADDPGEWLHEVSFANFKTGVASAYRSVQRNRMIARLGLVLIVAGFVLQWIGASQ